MKKLIPIVLLILLLSAVYFFIPNPMVMRHAATVTVNATAFNREFINERGWAWWPGEQLADKKGFQLNGNIYTITEKQLTSLKINIEHKGVTVPSELIFIPASPDSVTLTWIIQSATSGNPVTRVKRLFDNKSLQKDVQLILEKIKSFYGKEDNLYAVAIKKDFVLDSTLISTNLTTTGYPSTEIVYSLIDKLQAFAIKNGAKQTGLPMLNIYTSDSSSYRVQAALPVDKKLKDGEGVAYRWMLGGGNILVSEVKGGPYTINKGFDAMSNYVNDNRRTAPAIPFQSLVTDRRADPDTTKWVTKLYWPVM